MSCLDLGLRRRIGVLQLRTHAIELVRQHFDFVAGPELDPVGPLASAEPLSTKLQPLDKYHHAACKQTACSRC